MIRDQEAKLIRLPSRQNLTARFRGTGVSVRFLDRPEFRRCLGADRRRGLSRRIIPGVVVMVPLDDDGWLLCATGKQNGGRKWEQDECFHGLCGWNLVDG